MKKKINYKKLESIKISLMISESDINKETGKSDYLLKCSGEFHLPNDFFNELLKEEKDLLLSNLVEAIYNDLHVQNPNIEVDTVGLWIKYNKKEYENSIKISTLNDIKEWGDKDIVPIYEFFKLTLKV